MKSIQKMCLASVVGLLAALGNAAAWEDVNGVLAATDGAPPISRPQETPVPPEVPSDRARLTDSAITMKVRAQLLAAGLRSARIRVSTQNGIVHLDGNVPSDSDKLTALNAVRAVEGVQSVVDGLEVEK
ncbi:BON domain-containing protein [Cupriavidus sp. D39]|uniref:BON domain-containing protein n=1 Tax=Cupriavidus sp. D39 TaxID=2997877 RepID=UPI00226EED31|nr:BON domain-containing protein [Cupriavidus sp. D39]MCY0853351.1 BON domain-containing protein [Cupriavidus sp. D39]